MFLFKKECDANALVYDCVYLPHTHTHTNTDTHTYSTLHERGMEMGQKSIVLNYLDVLIGEANSC